jgi:peptidyl-prolyl cis-trans isomerase B (cyclophilin B)
MKKKLLTILLSAVLLITLTACGTNKEKKMNIYENVKKVAIEIQNYGTIKLDLYPDVAPISVENFINLANEHYYDGLTFHRIIKDFMMQGGANDGTKREVKMIKGEFSSNGVENPLKHERGVISMARATDKNSASSQFFIVHKTSPHLDGSYAAFGKVTEGLDIVDKICNETPVIDSNGTVLKENQPVIKTIYVIE